MLFSEIAFCCQNQKKRKDTECVECRYLKHLTNSSKRMIHAIQFFKSQFKLQFVHLTLRSVIPVVYVELK
jgi:hypothetical protein